jgi:hypothetical protein
MYGSERGVMPKMMMVMAVHILTVDFNELKCLLQYSVQKVDPLIQLKVQEDCQ